MTSDNWIPVSRETPKEADWYLVTRIHGRTGRKFVSRAFYSVNDQEFNEPYVTAWQPFPEPYEEEEVPNYDYLKEDGWILVTEELPKCYGRYQIAYKSKTDKTIIKTSDNVEWGEDLEGNNGFYFSRAVVAWRPSNYNYIAEKKDGN